MTASIIFVICFVFFIIALVRAIVFRVPDVHIGIPSSFFSGRLKKDKDENGHSVPIRQPYGEGLHFKPPWWTVKFVLREVLTKPILKREFPVGDGGTVEISGVIQYRVSNIAAYRYEEVDKFAIEEGFDAEIEQAIRSTLTDEDVDSAIRKTSEVSDHLDKSLKSLDLRTREERDRDPGAIKDKTLFGRSVTYSEHFYGIETLNAKIDTIDPCEDLKKARDDKQRERYEKESQSTEFGHLLEKAALLKEKLPMMADDKAWEAIQIWQKQLTKTVNKIEVEGDMLTGIAAGLIGKIGGKKDEQSDPSTTSK